MLFVTTIRVMPEAAIQQASHPASQPANTTSAAKPHAPFKRLVHSGCAFGPASMDNSLHWAVPRILPPLASHHASFGQSACPVISQSVHQPTSQSISQSAEFQLGSSMPISQSRQDGLLPDFSSQPISQSANQPVSQSASLPVSQSASQPVGQSARPPVSQSGSRTVSHVSQSARVSY